MRLRFRLGKSGRLGRLEPEQEAALERLEAGEITDDEAAAELGASVRTWRWSFGTGGDEETEQERPPTAEAAEDDPARELVERIAREVDAES